MKRQNFYFNCILIIFCIFLTGIIIGLGEVLISLDKQSEEALLNEAMHTAGALTAQDIQRNIASGIYATESLHNLLISSNYNTEKFNIWGEQIITGTKIASTVQLAPDGIVSYIYPLAGNEGAMGHDLLKDERRDDGALKAIQSRELTFIGPVKLIQNNEFAVIARKPIFRTSNGGIEDFWGFAIALIMVEDLISIDTYENLTDGIYFRLEGDDPDAETNPVFISSGDENYQIGITIKIAVPNGSWLLTINHEPIKNEYYKYLRIFIIVSALLLSGYIFFQQYRLKAKSMEISSLNEKLSELSLTDELTQAGNRRAAMLHLVKLISQSERYNSPLSVIMMDIDFFKEVNDTFGHPAGDKMLQHIVEILSSSVRESDSVFRLGGDEFFITFPQTDLTHCLDAAKKILNSLPSHPLNWESSSIELRVSMGIAELLRNDSIETLISRSDQMLYKAKQDGRNCIRYS